MRVRSDGAMNDFSSRRGRMVDVQIARRGVRDRPGAGGDARSAARALRRPTGLREFAYEDAPLPIERGADDLAALHRRRDDRGGRGRRPATACSRSAPAPATPRRCSAGSRGEVHRDRAARERSAERRASGWRRSATTMSTCASATARRAGRTRRRSTRSWSPPAAPEVPPALKQQLAIGGRLVIPVGERGRAAAAQGDAHASDRFEEEDLGAVTLRAADRRAGLAGGRRGARRATTCPARRASSRCPR